jgi:hypothetical protein
MKRNPRLLLVGGIALTSIFVTDLAPAQPGPPQAPPWARQPPPPPAVPRADPQQLTEIQGVVQRFTLSPRGELDGFLLADGVQVHLPPHLSAELAFAVRPRDAVSVRGYRSETVPLIVAVAVGDANTSQSVVDRGPSQRPAPPRQAPIGGARETTFTGKVQTPLYGPAGDLNGAALEDGVILRLPPAAAYQFAELLAPGKAIVARGFMLTTAFGRVVDAQDVSAPAMGPPD